MSKSISAFVLAATFLIGAATAQAQVNVYSTDFGVASGGTGTPPTAPASDGFQYQQNELTAGETKNGINGTTSGTGQNGWITNDPDNSATATSGAFVGGSNFVGPINDTTGTSVFTGSGAYVGGLQRSTTAGADVVPGAASTFLYRPFTVPTGASNLTFNADIYVTSPTGSSFTNRDSFAFTLRNTAGAQLLSINFSTSGNVMGTNTPAASDRLSAGYTVGGAAGTGAGTGLSNINPGNNGLYYNTKYHLTITVNVAANTFSAFYTSAGTQTIATNVSLGAGNISPLSVSQIAATWTLGNTTADAAGAYEGAGNNALAFDNYAITVPEPSTYAAMGLGVMVLVWLGWQRRLA